MAADKASKYLCAMCGPKFIVALCMCARFSRLLLLVRYGSLTMCKGNLQSSMCHTCRENAVSGFKTIVSKAQELSADPIATLRKTAHQLMRASYETNDPESFYCQSVYIPFVDGLLQELQGRFNVQFQTAAQIQLIMPRSVS